jgi:NAD(P)-dependent dehydrogenase (short-subunit alcohol dehydrogenase family)
MAAEEIVTEFKRYEREQAGLVVFPASPAGSYVAGETIVVDGG